MTKQIKKIDNVAARQVAFSKRRKGLFKKANELSTLCDAEIALIVFSATGRLFEYSTSSMQHVFERHTQHSEGLVQLDHPSAEGLPLENSHHAMLKKEIIDRTLEFRRLNGEELEGLKVKELKKLEELLNKSLKHVHRAKVERYLDKINILKNKGDKLLEENQSLKQVLEVDPQGQPSSDTSLRLGFPLPDLNESF